ncbi:vesicle coat component [Blyttiomyces sp. JEL0837]|nr:vesicle coat component [Blyttiomyces sp. JEL0837]
MATTTSASPSPSRSVGITTFLLLIAIVICSWTVGSVEAVRFEIYAAPGNGIRRCVMQYMGEESLVVGTFDVTPAEGQKLDVEFYDDGPNPNRFFQKANVNAGNQKFSFTVHKAAIVHFCFTNIALEGHHAGPTTKRAITLHVDTGAEVNNPDGDDKTKNLKPMEMELGRLERMADSLLREMDEMKGHEEHMRDVNESTNERVAWFSTLSMLALFGVAGWQVWYLRKFFQSKKLI